MFKISADGCYTPTKTPAIYAERLPNAVFSVAFAHDEFFLRPASPFVLPPKTYGKTSPHAKRILGAFASEPRSLGVLLAGEKGSGKTLLAKKVAIDSGLPVLLISQPFISAEFFLFLQEIDQPAVILFDEFEKVYDEAHQDALLTLFDGAYPLTRKLILLTVNSTLKVREHLRNRPGRLRYMIEFEGLDAAFIKEYCADKLQESKYLKDILRLALTCYSFNFDMLQSIVRELNEFGGDFEEMVEILNAKPPSSRMGGKMSWTWTITDTSDSPLQWKVDDGQQIYMQAGPWSLAESGRSLTFVEKPPGEGRIPKTREAQIVAAKKYAAENPDWDPDIAYVDFSPDTISGVDATTQAVTHTLDAGERTFKVRFTPDYSSEMGSSFTVEGL